MLTFVFWFTLVLTERLSLMFVFKFSLVDVFTFTDLLSLMFVLTDRLSLTFVLRFSLVDTFVF